ncbi:hypothetical protein A0J61_11044 [Choanephora cucurbitarum]|uniref:Uncharacterized protein n=1 Tax=Choanephora cucurbitarum TaxID=101091 RepID=A0A1C7MVV5_9FUNG|nr:hypothetical protein A0J61_11044 [Choanephora cucurbitarum]
MPRCKALKHRECKVAVKFTLIYDEVNDLTSYVVKCEGRHSHEKYKRLHLWGEKDKVLHEKVQNDHFIVSKSFSIGVTSLPGQFTSMAKGISSALGNQDRAKYQLSATKASLGISKSTGIWVILTR